MGAEHARQRCAPGLGRTPLRCLISITGFYGDWASQQNIGIDRYEFQMLYGIRRDLQINFAETGHRIRVYTPFGSYWYPYLMRRLAERPANMLFVLKNMLKG